MMVRVVIALQTLELWAHWVACASKVLHLNKVTCSKNDIDHSVITYAAYKTDHPLSPKIRRETHIAENFRVMLVHLLRFRRFYRLRVSV